MTSASAETVGTLDLSYGVFGNAFLASQTRALFDGVRHIYKPRGIGLYFVVNGFVSVPLIIGQFLSLRSM